MTAAHDDTLGALLSAAGAIWPAPARIERPDVRQSEPGQGPREQPEPSGPPEQFDQPDPLGQRDQRDQGDQNDQGDHPGGHRLLAEFLVVPSLDKPRLVVPANAPRAVAAAFSRTSDDVGTRTRLVRAAATRALRMPAVASALRHPTLLGSDDRRSNRLTVTAPAGAAVPSLQHHLSELLSTDVLLCFGVGNPRANRKPVVQVIDPGGHTVAWAKLGIDPVGQELVRCEAEALRAFWSNEQTPDHLIAPRILQAGPWGETELLVLSPLLPTAHRRRQPRPADQSSAWPPQPERPRRGQPPREAMAELAGRFGIETRPLAETEFWRKIRKVPELADPVAAAEAEYGERIVALGAWHGDWTPWNMLTDGDRVLLWDFERFTCGVPVGLDAAHYRLQTALHTGGERAARQLLIDGPLVDEPGGELLTSVYLLELARRWVRASESHLGAPLRPRTAWLLGLLDEWLVGSPKES